MTRLRRVRLDGVGPTGARFDPVTIDLTNRTDAAARVALIHLENGGGKSVLLKLLFAAVLPGRRNTLGGVKLGDFVLAGDTGHVALEWAVDDGTGGEALLVTGTVLEWRNKAKSSDQSNLRQWWYAFHPVVGVLDLDSLPTRADGRRPSRSAFRDRLIESWHAAPALELADEDGPDRWRDWLLNHTSIDPELFSYQRAMNADEADAEELFSGIRTGDDFVRMLLQAVVDPDEMRSFGDTLGTFAAQLARREGLERERAFVGDATAVLGPLAEAHAAVVRTSDAVVTTRRDMWVLRASLAAEAERADVEATRLGEAAAQAESDASERDEQAGRLVTQGQELRRREAEFLVTDATERLAHAKAQSDLAAKTAEAWQVVDAILAQWTAAAEQVRLRRALLEADVLDAPLRAERDRAAAALGARLDAEATATEHAAEAHDADAKEAAQQRQDAVARHDAATTRAAELRAEARADESRADEDDAALEELVERGIIARGETSSDAEQRWTVTAIESETDLDARRRDAESIVERQRSMQTDSERLAELVIELRPGLSDARREHSRLLALVVALTSEDRLSEVVGAAAVNIWVQADSLLNAFADAIETSERALRDLSLECTADQRALEALGESGLLPASAEVEAVWDVLTAGRIPATSGWLWLSERRDPEERARLLSDHPGLAGGVVITDPSRLEEACDTVAAAGLDLRSIVSVGASADFTGADTADAGGRSAARTPWAAPVHRGLYDEAWADDERTRIEARLGLASVTRRELEQQAATDRALDTRLRQLYSECPAGHLDDMSERITDLGGSLDRAESERSRIGNELGALAEEATALHGVIETLESAVETATLHAGLCERQAQRDLDSVRRRSDAARARVDARELDLTIQTAKADEQRAATAGDEGRDRAARARRIAEAHREELNGLPVVGAAVDPDESVPTAVLRNTYTRTSERLVSDSTATVLAGELQVAEARETDAQKTIARHGEAVVSEAKVLATSPAAGDASSRTEAQRDAQSHAARCQEVVTAVAGDLRVAEEELKTRTPQGRARWIDLTEDLDPRDNVHARELATRLGEEQRRVAEQARELHARARTAQRAADDATSRASVFGAHLQTLTVDDTPIDATGATPFDGSLEEATRQVGELARDHRAANRDFEQAVVARTEAIELVRGVGLKSEYAQIGGAQTALAEENPSTLAPRAAQLAEGLLAIGESIDAELADVQRHRDGLIERLTTLVQQNLSLLRLAQRMSVIPADLGEWHNKPFITINFQVPDDNTLAVRMGTAIDSAVNANKRDAATIVLSAVRTAVVRHTAEGEKAFTVSIMKPNAAMFDATVDVSRLSTEFSGGQRLTAAILLYCTLASLRAYVRGQDRAADPGVLFLDNPIGKASADYLLDLQIAVAERRGVQLVYTTGISDPEVHASFEAIARLRNDADLRRHLNYIVVDDGLAERLANGRDLDDPAGYLSSVRLASSRPT